MAVRMRVHSAGIGMVPEIQALPYDPDSAPAVVIGSVVILTSGLLAVAGADPDDIVGVALQAVDTNPGFDAANSPAPITGRSAKVSVVRPNQTTTFLATLTSGSSATHAPAAANVGVEYGITAYSGIWTVDEAKTGADARVIVTGYDTEIYGGVVFFKFLTAHLAGNDG